LQSIKLRFTSNCHNEENLSEDFLQSS
jgi:hypothetical protein